MNPPEFSAAVWRKSSYSAHQGTCVEVAAVPGRVGVRDSKRRAGGHLAVSRAAWLLFTRGMRAGVLTR